MATGLYPTILKVLQDAGRPLTCGEVFDHPDVRAFDVTSVRVSDYLGNLWRRGEVKRVGAQASANAGARSRYAFEVVNASRELGDFNSSRPYVQQLLDRAGITIEDHGSHVVVKNKKSRVEVYPDKTVIS